MRFVYGALRSFVLNITRPGLAAARAQAAGQLAGVEAELRDGEEEVQQESQVHRPVLVSGSGPSDNPLDDAMAQEDPAQAIVLTRDARPMPFV